MGTAIRYPVAQPVLAGRETEYVLEAMSSGWISSGPYVNRFERLFAEELGVRQCLSTCNGTAALHIACAAMGLQPGMEVIVPSLTYIASVNAIAYCGATPAFADSDRRTWNVTRDSIEAAWTPRTAGVIAVHLYGMPAPVDDIADLCRERNVWLIEDCAESLGATLTTGTIAFADKSADVAQAILKKALWFDIISIPRVPRDIHRLLYRFAALTIHPSFFEGGFPFVFAKSVGAGTPCLLARNAAVAEVFPDNEAAAFTFDPYLSPESLAVTIKNALANRAEILRQQQAILDRMAARSWSDVATEYMQVFRAAVGEPGHHGSSDRIRPRTLGSPYAHEPASVPHG